MALDTDFQLKKSLQFCNLFFMSYDSNVSLGGTSYCHGQGQNSKLDKLRSSRVFLMFLLYLKHWVEMDGDP